MPRSIEIHYQGRTPSINSVYMNVRGKGRVMKPEGKAFKTEVKLLARKAGPINDSPWYFLDVIFMLPLRTKAGDQRKWDITNHIKLLEDAMCDGLGINDKSIVMVRAVKEEGDWGFKATLIGAGNLERKGRNIRRGTI